MLREEEVDHGSLLQARVQEASSVCYCTFQTDIYLGELITILIS